MSATEDQQAGQIARRSVVGEDFYSNAYRRIVLDLLVLVPCSSLGLWLGFNRAFAIGFLVGGGVAIFNFVVLKRLIIALADRVISSAGRERSSGLALRFVLRYVLVAAVAYAIFKSSPMSAYGLLAGLGIPGIAIMMEAAYEMYVSFR
jgi:small-conductance mechanosensitive channel